jgi:RNA polymerase sigma-70 factor (ECF subfamily)
MTVSFAVMPTALPFSIGEFASVMRPRRGTMGPMSSHVPGGDVTERVASAIERAATGDQAAFAEFYDEVSPVVFGTVLKVLRNQAMAEEVTQEVFLELWRQAPKYDRSKGSPKAWSATVAHRRAVDRVRSEESARSRDEADARLAAVDHDVVVEQVTTDLDREHVIGALAQLSDAQREAVTLAYYGGHTYREVAAMLNVPEGTIKTRIRDGLIRLRDLMGVTP